MSRGIVIMSCQLYCKTLCEPLSIWVFGSICRNKSKCAHCHLWVQKQGNYIYYVSKSYWKKTRPAPRFCLRQEYAHTALAYFPILFYVLTGPVSSFSLEFCDNEQSTALDVEGGTSCATISCLRPGIWIRYPPPPTLRIRSRSANRYA